MNSAADNSKADHAAVARVLAGDVRAFEEIVRRWQGPLINMAWRYCRDRSRAEEMAQEAFLRAWRNLKSWRQECSFSSWLFALAANLYRSELKRFPTETLPIEDAPEPASPARQVNDAIERRRAEALRRAVLALPMRYREPVILFYFHEMDLTAAAASLRMPEGTLKARLSRARTLLRNRFPHLRSELDSTRSTPENTPQPSPQKKHLQERHRNDDRKSTFEKNHAQGNDQGRGRGDRAPVP